MVMSPVGCQLYFEKFVRKGNESVRYMECRSYWSCLLDTGGGMQLAVGVFYLATGWHPRALRGWYGR